MTTLLVMKFDGIWFSPPARHGPLIAVVSAVSRITELLLDMMKHAEASDRLGDNTNVEQPAQRHRAACRELPNAEQTLALPKVDALNGKEPV